MNWLPTTAGVPSAENAPHAPLVRQAARDADFRVLWISPRSWVLRVGTYIHHDSGIDWYPVVLEQPEAVSRRYRLLHPSWPGNNAVIVAHGQGSGCVRYVA